MPWLMIMTLCVTFLLSSASQAQNRGQGSTENDLSPHQSPPDPGTVSSEIFPPITASNLSSDLSDLIDVCPYSDICQYRGRGSRAANTSCCTSCSCEPSCGVIGNCCDGRLNVERRRSCYRPLVTDDSEFALSKETGHWLIDRCANSSSDTDCKSMSSDPWGSMYPVYDAATDVSYYNELCAECNGVQEYTHWDVGVSCNRLDVYYSNEVIVGGLLGKGCGVSFKPPREQHDNQVCYPDPIQQCNVTGLWLTYDPELELACYRWFSPARSHSMPGAFANVFCLLCNGLYYDRESRCEVLSSNTEAMLFTTAIDYRRIASALSEPANQQPRKWVGKCSEHMVKHPLKDECRVVLCPDGYLRVDGECVPLSSEENELAYLIQFEMTPTTDNLVPMAHLHEVFGDEARLSKAEIWFNSRGVSLEFLSFFAQPVNINNVVFAKGLIVRIGQLTSTIIVDEVLKTIKNALGKEWELSLYGQVYRFSVNIDKFREFVFDGSHPRYSEVELIERQSYTINPNGVDVKMYEPIGQFYLHQQILPSIYLTKMNFCEKVHLERSEWIGLWQEIRMNLTGSDDGKVLGDSEYNMYADDQGKATVDICVEDFDPLYYSYTANSAPAFNSFCLLLVCVCSLFFPTLLFTKI